MPQTGGRPLQSIACFRENPAKVDPLSGKISSQTCKLNLHCKHGYFFKVKKTFVSWTFFSPFRTCLCSFCGLFTATTQGFVDNLIRDILDPILIEKRNIFWKWSKTCRVMGGNDETWSPSWRCLFPSGAQNHSLMAGNLRKTTKPCLALPWTLPRTPGASTQRRNCVPLGIEK